MGALFGQSAGGGVRYALLVVLGLVGLDAAAHGLVKVAMGPVSMGGGLLADLGLPFPTFLGVMVMLVELIGGILLLVIVVREATSRRGQSPSRR